MTSPAPRVFIPITGRLIWPESPGLSPRNSFGESLDREWHGAELGFFESERSAAEALTEVRCRGWAVGVHWPLVFKDPQQPRWFDSGAAVRQAGLDEATEAVRVAAGAGADYVLFHFPWPGLLEDGVDYFAQGWYFTTPPVAEADWPPAATVAWADEVLGRLDESGRAAGVEVVLELDGPSRLFYAGPPEGDVLTRLMQGRPGLGLCLDTGRLSLLALTHGQEPLALARRWYRRTSHLHLHAANWRDHLNHVPVSPDHRASDGWAPAADIARELASARLGLRLVLEHSPSLATPEELEATHHWVRNLPNQD